MRQLLVWSLCLIVVGGLSAQEPAEEPPESYSLTVRRSAAHAAEFLLNGTEENLHGLVVQPVLVPRYRKELRRFRERRYTVRVPEYKFEYVEVTRPVGSGSERRMAKVKERRIVGISGYHDEERVQLIHDKEGPIERMWNVPFYDEESLLEGIRMPHGLLGYNAMALHTFVMLGYDTQDPRIRRLKGALEMYILNFGVPDNTFDVAWLTAAFCRWPEKDEQLETIRLVLIRKLLSGQVNDARIKGLWGPECLDDEVVVAHLKRLGKIYEELTVLKQELKIATDKERERDVIKIEKKLSAAETLLEEEEGRMKFVTWRAPEIMGDPAREIRLQPPHDGGPTSPDFTDTLYPIRPSVPMIYPFLERTTDLESTMWALYALAEVEAAGYLPARLDRPDVGSDAFRPYEVGKMIKAAFDGVVACYDPKQKGWLIGNQWVDMRKRYYSGLKWVVPKEDVKLDNPATLMADTAAYQCLSSLDRIAGLDDLSSSSGGLVRASESRLEQALTALKGMRMYSKLPHGARNPIAYISSLNGYQWSLGGLELTRPSAFEDYSKYLMRIQQDDGGWGPPNTYTILDSPSAIENYRIRYKQFQATLDQPDKERAHYWRFHFRGRAPQTLEALRYLADGTWPAVAVHWKSDGLSANPVVLPRGLRYLNRRGGTLSYVRTNEWPPPEIPDVPAAVVLTGKGALSAADAKALEPLFPYIRAGGLVVAEAPASEEGIAFARSLFEALTPALPDKTFGDIPDDTYLLAELPKRPPLRGVMDGDGSIAVIFLMVGKETEGYSLSKSAAGQVLATLLKARLPPLLLEQHYPVLDDNAMPFQFATEEEGEEEAAE